MKALKLASAITALVFVFALGLGNIFHNQIRKMVDQNYVFFNVRDTQINQLLNQRHPEYWFNIATEKDSYYPYQRILVYGKIARKDDMTVPAEAVIEVEFIRNGQAMPNIRGETRTKLIYNPYQEVWIGYWYPADTGIRGEVTVRATGYLDNPQAPLQIESHFTISEMPARFTLDKGSCFIGIDSTERITPRSLLSPEGTEVDWNAIPRWVTTVSADGVFMLGGITKSFNEHTSLDSPWDRDKVSETGALAERIRGINRQFGVWIKSLELEGTYLEKIGYSPSLYLNGNNYARADSIISYADEARKEHIARLFADFMGNPSVDYVGLSRIFHDDNYDVELFETFFKEFQIAIPANWDDLSFDQKFRYFSTRMNDPMFMKEFLRWKNYTVASYIQDIVKQSGHSKPVFYFLNHTEILKNPEILTILFNSGVDFVVLNINANYLNLGSLMDRLKETTDIDKYFDRVVLSYEIDYNNVDIQNFRLSAMENYIQANMEIARFGSDEHVAQGLLINDLYEAMFGKRGPYSPYEWMIAIGKTIFEFKSLNKNYPLAIDSYTSMANYAAGIFPTVYHIVNTTGSEIKNIKLTFLPVAEEDKLDAFNRTIATLGAGQEMTLEIPIQINSQNPQLLKKRYFIGMRISWDPVGSNLYENNGYIDFIPLDMQNIRSVSNASPQ